VTDLDSAKEHEVETDHNVGLVFVNAQRLPVDHGARHRAARSHQGGRNLENYR
jgi:hypothetical protein